ncbi:MAG: YceD family protein [bacterium]
MSLYLDIAGCEPGAHLLEGEEDASSFGFPEQVVAVTDPVRFALRVTRDGPTIVVSGEVDVVARRICDRCLSDFSDDVQVDLREIYHLGDVEFSDTDPDDDEVHFVGRRATRVDLAPVIRQRVMLELPMKSLCRDDCKGICPVCGVNRNDAACQCATQSDPRWRALGGLGEKRSQ